jgi:hypothetical protein
MSAKAVRNAKKRREELRKELEKIEQFLSLYEEFSDAAKGIKKIASIGSGGEGGSKPMVVEKNLAAKPVEVISAARVILDNSSRPMSRSELLNELLKSGLNIDATDKAKYVGTILWRNGDVFVQIEGRGYWLKGKPFPETGYSPEGGPEGTPPGKSNTEVAILH